MRNLLAIVPKGNQEMVAGAIRTIFVQPDAEHVHEQFEAIGTMLGKQSPKDESMLRDAHDDLLAVTGFPVTHWNKIWWTTPLERRNNEVESHRRRRGLPNLPPCQSLARAVLLEAHGEWQVSAERRCILERFMAVMAVRAVLAAETDEEVAKPELMTA